MWTFPSVPSHASRDPPEGMDASAIGNGNVSPSFPYGVTALPRVTSVTRTMGAVHAPTTLEQLPTVTAPPAPEPPAVVCAPPAAEPPLAFVPPAGEPPLALVPPAPLPPAAFVPPLLTAPPGATPPVETAPPFVEVTVAPLPPPPIDVVSGVFDELLHAVTRPVPETKKISQFRCVMALSAYRDGPRGPYRGVQ